MSRKWCGGLLAATWVRLKGNGYWPAGDPLPIGAEPYVAKHEGSQESDDIAAPHSRQMDQTEIDDLCEVQVSDKDFE